MLADEQLTREIIKKFKIPPTPFALKEIQEEFNKSDFQLSSVANIIAQDAGLSALMLRSVNSPLFALTQHVNSIHQAIKLLGAKNTLNIVSGLLLRNNLNDSGFPSPPKFWDSPTNIALVSAALGKILSQFLNKSFSQLPGDEAYMLGLFHNVGHAIMMSQFSDYAEFLENQFNCQTNLVELEQQTYGLDHAELGYQLAMEWKLPKAICKTIRWHHQLDPQFLKEKGFTEIDMTRLCILKIAEHIDKCYWGVEDDYEWLFNMDVILDHIGLSEPDFEEISADLLERLISGS